MAQISSGRTGAKARFEAGDRPTDQDFADLFDSILFLGETNPNNNGLTTISDDLIVDGTFSSTGAFIVDNIVMFGKASGEETHDKPLQIYGDENETMVYVSGSQSDVLFEGISGDATSSIKLVDPSTHIRLGTYGNKGFLEIHEKEIITFSTGSSAGDNLVYVSGSVGIGTTSPSKKLHVFEGSDDVFVQLETDKTNGKAQIYYLNDAQQFNVGVATNDNFVVYDHTNTSSPFVVEPGAASNTLRVDGNSRVGIGTSSPGETLEVIGNISASGFISASGLAIAGSNVRVAEGDVIASRTGSFSYLKSSIISGTHFGDGSGLTGISSNQVALFGGNVAENNLVTMNASTTGLDGEANLKFDSSNLQLKGRYAIATGSAALFTPDAPLHIKHTGTELGSVDFIHLSMESNTTEGEIGIKFSDASDVSNQHFRIIFDEGNQDLRFKSDSDDNIIYLEHGGNVGIGTNAPKVPLHIDGGTDVTLTDGSGFLLIGDQDSTNLVIDDNEIQARNNAATATLIVQNEGGEFRVDADRLVVEDGGNVGIGTDSPGEKLHIAGTTSATRAMVKTTTGNAIFKAQTNNSNFQLLGRGDSDQFDLYDVNATKTPFKVVGGNPTNTLVLDGSGNIGIGTDSPQNLLHIKFSNAAVGSTHDDDIGILIENASTGDAGIEFEAGGQYWSMYLDNSAGDLTIRDISNSRNLAVFTDSGNVAFPTGHVYGRSVNNQHTKLYRFGGLYLTWDSDTYGTDLEHSITSTDNGTFSDDITINSYGHIRMNFDSNGNTTNTFSIGHHTTGTGNTLFTMDETGLITTTNTIKMADTSNYWIATGASTNWGLYWDTSENQLQFHGNGNLRAYIDLDDPGNAFFGGNVLADNATFTEAPAAGGNNVKVGMGTSTSFKIQTNHGYVEVGPHNGSWSHFYTDTQGYYFDEKIVTNGNLFASYGNNDLKLRRDYDDSSYNEIVIGNNQTFFRQDNDIRFRVNNGNVWIDNKLWVGGDYQSHSGTEAVPTRDLAIGDGDTGFDNEADGELGMFSNNTRIGRYDNGDTRLGINGSPVKIGNDSAPSGNSTLHVKQIAASGINTMRGIVCENDSNSNFWNISHAHGNNDVTFTSATQMFVLSFNGSGQNGGYALSNTFGGDGLFTGQHRNIPHVGETTDYISKIGYIVSSTGTIKNVPGEADKEIDKANINEALPTVKLSNTIKDKAVYGVISELEDPESSIRTFQHGVWGSNYELPEGDARLVINSLGEGGIMVCNINGNIENGDYITTSEVEGIGMKQDDDILRNYTVAKTTMKCDFLPNENYILGSVVHNGVTYKTAFIGCTYHCG